MAGLIDILVFLPIAFLSDSLFPHERGVPLLIIWGVAYYSATWLYGVVMHARYGKTIGKMVMGIIVLDLSEDRLPSFQQAFFRDIFFISTNILSLVYFIYLVLFGEYVPGAVEASMPGQIVTWTALSWFVLEILTMLTNSKRRAIHDFIASTVETR